MSLKNTRSGAFYLALRMHRKHTHDAMMTNIVESTINGMGSSLEEEITMWSAQLPRMTRCGSSR